MDLRLHYLVYSRIHLEDNCFSATIWYSYDKFITFKEKKNDFNVTDNRTNSELISIAYCSNYHEDDKLHGEKKAPKDVRHLV